MHENSIDPKELPYRQANERWPDDWLRVTGFDSEGNLMVRRMTEPEIAEARAAKALTGHEQ